MLESEIDLNNLYINKITMDCLLNTKQKQKMNNNDLINNNLKYDKKDKKFYRRRIINLTKEMLLNNNSDDVLYDVKEAFDNYIKTCIGFFKVKDEVDIIQSDICYFDEINLLEKTDMDDIVTAEEADKLMMRTIKINKLPLDNFVTIKILKNDTVTIMPMQKEINLRDPILKNKGIRKKKNIDKDYIEDENKN